MDTSQSLKVVIVIFITIILLVLISFGIVFGALNLRLPGTDGGIVDIVNGNDSSGTIIYKFDNSDNKPLHLPSKDGKELSLSQDLRQLITG